AWLTERREAGHLQQVTLKLIEGPAGANVGTGGLPVFPANRRSWRTPMETNTCSSRPLRTDPQCLYAGVPQPIAAAEEPHRRRCAGRQPSRVLLPPAPV